MPLSKAFLYMSKSIIHERRVLWNKEQSVLLRVSRRLRSFADDRILRAKQSKPLLCIVLQLFRHVLLRHVLLRHVLLRHVLLR